MYLKRILLSGMVLLAGGNLFAQKKFNLSSPDKSITVKLSVSDSIYYELSQDNKVLATTSAIYFKTDETEKSNWKVSKSVQTTGNAVLKPVVWQKNKTIVDNYNQLHIDFSNGLSLEWRLYNNGVAWRWINNSKKSYKVLDEQAVLNLPAGATSWYPQEDNFFSHNEREYKKYTVKDIDHKKLASLPVLFDVSGPKILLTESDLWNYAGMWVRGNGKGGVRAVFPNYAKTKKITSDRDEKVIERENFIAKIDGAKSFPWRILMVAKNDIDIISNELPYQLSTPSTGDYSWVKPGKVQWDWWHYNNIYNVDFRAGVNNDTYKHYIDFAAKHNIEYVLLDEGWCDTRDLMKQAPGIDVKELADYAKAKGVDLLLWSSWLVLDQQLDMALDQFAKWGIKGIKVDFMQRDDQEMVNYYEKVAVAAAKRKLLVDFHGSYKPTGWLRTYPNVMTSEGVLGNEISKFAGSIDANHTSTLPFTRMAAGPMDFTPGGMLNVHKKEFAANPAEPMTIGTRSNQMAMYVVFESPLQMLCDMPTHYYNEPESMQFISAVPAVWQKTVALNGAVGKFITIARQAPNNDWYIGSMTNNDARELEINLSFLGDGNYAMHVWKDGINADKNAKDFKMETIDVTKNSKVKIKMTTGGGYVARIIKK